MRIQQTGKPASANLEEFAVWALSMVHCLKKKLKHNISGTDPVT
jgi:hypothetical protein